MVEDAPEKAEEISKLIGTCCEPGQLELKQVSNINDAIHALGSTRFDLIVADLILPQITGAPEPQDATLQWCELIENHENGGLSSWVIMTGFSEIAASARQSFARHGVAVIQYDDAGTWKKVLTNRIRERFVNPALDFVIICALEKERRALEHCQETALGAHDNVKGLDCREVSIGSLRGVAIVQANPGLVSAAIVTSKATEVFKPRAVAMCGICGGIEGESELGDIIVPDVSWNYQSGKFMRGQLKQELLQTVIPPLVKTRIKQLINDEVSQALRTGLLYPELARRKIRMLPMVSGSQVVADKAVGQSILSQSRKVGAVDMEVASVFAAAHDFFNGAGIYLAGKTVVDLADEDKDDRYHEYGAVISARFVVRALAAALEGR